MATAYDSVRSPHARRKNLCHLMERWLQENGFFDTAVTLRKESRLTDEFELCDNVDLDTVYLEYTSYHNLKFGKYPKVLRQVKQPIKISVDTPKRGPNIKKVKSSQNSPKEAIVELKDLQVTVTKIETENGAACKSVSCKSEKSHDRIGDGVFLGSVLPGNEDWHNLSELIKTTIMRGDLQLSWTDICGNADAIDVVNEAVVVPIKYPELFSNGLRPWKSVLLHGPPGSGKTLLAKTLYAETRQDVTFFNVTSSVVVSKWRGESEKIIKILFHMAQTHAPSVIFFDEIEGLTSRRDRPSDHESSKRFKNELLQLLDGMEQMTRDVFILASTNIPWEIDEAFLRRFEKKILVQLPNDAERAKLIGALLPITLHINSEQMKMLVKISEHFTGDEIRLACKEIAMTAVRRITKGLDTNAVPMEHAFEQVKPLSVRVMGRHVKWQKENGS